nr:TPA_asm: NADH dehydrogenase subunit 6 [Tetraponera aethiops]
MNMNNMMITNMIMYTLMIIIMLIMISLGEIHPTYLIILMIMFSIMVCISFSLTKENPLYSIILFMVMISGVLIIFLYFSSLISNEQSKLKYKNLLLIPIPIILMIFTFNKQLIPINNNEEINHYLSINESTFSNIKMIYSYPFSNLTMKCMLYLLISLFSVIKITSIKNSSLRKIN